jgi:hypothetical protein
MIEDKVVVDISDEKVLEFVKYIEKKMLENKRGPRIGY